MQKITEEGVVNGLTANCTKEWANTFITLTKARFDKNGALVKVAKGFQISLAKLYARSEREVLIPKGFISNLAAHFRVTTSVLRGTAKEATDIQKDPLAILILQKQQELLTTRLKVEEKIATLNTCLDSINSDLSAYDTVVANFGLDK